MLESLPLNTGLCTDGTYGTPNLLSAPNQGIENRNTFMPHDSRLVAPRAYRLDRPIQANGEEAHLTVPIIGDTALIVDDDENTISAYPMLNNKPESDAAEKKEIIANFNSIGIKSIEDIKSTESVVLCAAKGNAPPGVWKSNIVSGGISVALPDGRTHFVPILFTVIETRICYVTKNDYNINSVHVIAIYYDDANLTYVINYIDITISQNGEINHKIVNTHGFENPEFRFFTYDNLSAIVFKGAAEKNYLLLVDNGKLAVVLRLEIVNSEINDIAEELPPLFGAFLGMNRGGWILTGIQKTENSPFYDSDGAYVLYVDLETGAYVKSSTEKVTSSTIAEIEIGDCFEHLHFNKNDILLSEDDIFSIVFTDYSELKSQKIKDNYYYVHYTSSVGKEFFGCIKNENGVITADSDWLNTGCRWVAAEKKLYFNDKKVKYFSAPKSGVANCAVKYAYERGQEELRDYVGGVGYYDAHIVEGTALSHVSYTCIKITTNLPSWLSIQSISTTTIKTRTEEKKLSMVVVGNSFDDPIIIATETKNSTPTYESDYYIYFMANDISIIYYFEQYDSGIKTGKIAKIICKTFSDRVYKWGGELDKMGLKEESITLSITGDKDISIYKYSNSATKKSNGSFLHFSELKMGNPTVTRIDSTIIGDPNVTAQDDFYHVKYATVDNIAMRYKPSEEFDSEEGIDYSIQDIDQRRYPALYENITGNYSGSEEYYNMRIPRLVRNRTELLPIDEYFSLMCVYDGNGFPSAVSVAELSGDYDSNMSGVLLTPVSSIAPFTVIQAMKDAATEDIHVLLCYNNKFTYKHIILGNVPASKRLQQILPNIIQINTISLYNLLIINSEGITNEIGACDYNNRWILDRRAKLTIPPPLPTADPQPPESRLCSLGIAYAYHNMLIHRVSTTPCQLSNFMANVPLSEENLPLCAIGARVTSSEFIGSLNTIDYIDVYWGNTGNEPGETPFARYIGSIAGNYISAAPGNRRKELSGIGEQTIVNVSVNPITAEVTRQTHILSGAYINPAEGLFLPFPIFSEETNLYDSSSYSLWLTGMPYFGFLNSLAHVENNFTFPIYEMAQYLSKFDTEKYETFMLYGNMYLITRNSIRHVNVSGNLASIDFASFPVAIIPFDEFIGATHQAALLFNDTEKTLGIFTGSNSIQKLRTFIKPEFMPILSAKGNGDGVIPIGNTLIASVRDRVITIDTENNRIGELAPYERVADDATVDMISEDARDIAVRMQPLGFKIETPRPDGEPQAGDFNADCIVPFKLDILPQSVGYKTWRMTACLEYEFLAADKASSEYNLAFVNIRIFSEMAKKGELRETGRIKVGVRALLSNKKMEESKFFYINPKDFDTMGTTVISYEVINKHAQMFSLIIQIEGGDSENEYGRGLDYDIMSIEQNRSETTSKTTMRYELQG